MKKPKHNQHASLAKPVSTFQWGDGNSVIYAWCQGGNQHEFKGMWMAEDGVFLGKLYASTIQLLQFKMSDDPVHWQLEMFRAHYPYGYRIEWVPMNQVRQHKGLMEAYSRNQTAGKLAAIRIAHRRATGASPVAPARARMDPAS